MVVVVLTTRTSGFVYEPAVNMEWDFRKASLKSIILDQKYAIARCQSVVECNYKPADKYWYCCKRVEPSFRIAGRVPRDF